MFKDNNRRKIYDYDEEFFSKVNILNSYWAGFIAADFHIRGNNKHPELSCSLATKDKDQLVRFMGDIKHNSPVRTRERFRKQTKLSTSEISFTSRKYINDLLINFNICRGKKTERLEHPINLDKDCELSFIVGYFDGDGWLRYKKGQGLNLGFCGTYQMVSWIKLVLEGHIVDLNKTTKIKKNKGCWSWVAGSNSEYLAELLERVPVIKMERKLPKIHEYKKQIEENFLNGRINITSSKRNKNYGWGKIKYKGVYQQNDLYVATARKKDGSKKYLGSFETSEEAAKHYDFFTFKEFGKDCYLNFPEEDYNLFNPSTVDRRNHKRKNFL